MVAFRHLALLVMLLLAAVVACSGSGGKSRQPIATPASDRCGGNGASSEDESEIGTCPVEDREGEKGSIR